MTSSALRNRRARASGAAPAVPGHERLLRAAGAVAIAGGPLAFLVGGMLAPSIRQSGQASIAANAAANPIGNATHVAAFVVASFLLPAGAIGLSCLAYRSTPRLATAAGLLGLVGWLPFSALAALDELSRTMAGAPGSGSYATLLDQFTNGPVMNTYLIIYIVGHLVAYVLFGVALRRARVLPRWAAWAMIASSPLTIAAFVVPGQPLVLGDLALALLLVSSLPAARAMITRQHLCENQGGSPVG